MIMQKLKRQMYIEYKDPNRMMLKGGIIIEAKDAKDITDKTSVIKPSQGATLGRRRGSQKIIAQPGEGNNLEIQDTKKSFVNLLDKKDIEIVKGLFQMQITE